MPVNCDNKKYIKIYDCTSETVLDISNIFKCPELTPRTSESLNIGDKIIMGISIGVNTPENGWKLMPNWIALVERGVGGRMIESPLKKAKFDDTLSWPDSD